MIDLVSALRDTRTVSVISSSRIIQVINVVTAIKTHSKCLQQQQKIRKTTKNPSKSHI